MISHKEEKEILQEEIMEYANKNGFDYIETSALSGFNVENAFRLLGQRVLEVLKKDKTEAKKPKSKNDSWLLNILDKKPTEDNLWKLYDEIDNQLEKEKEKSQILDLCLSKISSYFSQSNNKLLLPTLNMLKGKILILLAKQKYKEGSLQLFVDLYIDGLKNYFDAINMYNQPQIKETKALPHALNYLFSLFSEMIAKPFDLKLFLDKLKENNQVIQLGQQFGDRFFPFLLKCLQMIQIPTYELFQDIRTHLDRIQLVFEKNHPHRKIAALAFKNLVKQLPPVLVIDKSVDPDPLDYGVPAFIKLALKNIYPRRRQVNLNVSTTTRKDLFTKKQTLDPSEVFEFIIPLDNIQSPKIGIYFDIQIRKGKSFKTILQDYLLKDVQTTHVTPILYIMTQTKRLEWKKASEIEIFVIIFNPAPCPLEIQLLIEPSWLSLRSLPIISIPPHQSYQERCNFALPHDVIGNYNIKFRLLNPEGHEIPNSTQIVEFNVEESKKAKIINFVKGISIFGLRGLT